ncbi:hypothetical protein [Ornithinimicrobium panacihumi]|uniref:hypothetical protein n=1 Tax=Ornithinimicrobium panacihumi TaxID=2008449 RepID=UPI003F88C07C
MAPGLSAMSSCSAARAADTIRARRGRGLARVRGERGATSVEVAGMLPILLVVILFLGHAVAIVAGVDATTHAAREAARAASQGGAAGPAAAQAIPGWMRLDSVGALSCADACVQVKASVPLGIPGVVTVTHIQITRDATFARVD